MSVPMLAATTFEVNTETSADRIRNAHHDANNLITWLSIPGVAEKYALLDVGYIIGLFKLLMESCTKEEAITDIYLLAEYVKMAVGAGC